MGISELKQKFPLAYDIITGQPEEGQKADEDDAMLDQLEGDV